MGRGEGERKGRRARSVSRRAFLTGLGAAGAGAGMAGTLLESDASVAAPELAPPGAARVSGPVHISLVVNGRPTPMTVEPRTTLVNALRNAADPPITGPKLICDEGACGGCTVEVDGKTAYACNLLAVDMVGRKITTVEGLTGPGGALHPVQEAFVEKDGLMCGFCTPGFVMSVHALLQKNPNPTLDEVKEACAGNTCRCGTYPRVFEAALDAARRGGGRA